jgi:hypothetical protein
MAELVASEQQRSFGLDKRDTLPAYCRACDVRFACHVDQPMRMMSELLGWYAARDAHAGSPGDGARGDIRSPT